MLLSIFDFAEKNLYLVEISPLQPTLRFSQHPPGHVGVDDPLKNSPQKVTDKATFKRNHGELVAKSMVF